MFEIIEQLIEVKRPYYSLSNMTADSSGVSAFVESEHPMENEYGDIAAAEAGRHLAILGSCALAITNPVKSRHYYLAHKALLKRVADNECINGSHFKVDSRTTYFDKRRGKAHSRLYSGDRHIFDLNVEYHVIKESIFNKLYKEKAEIYQPSLTSPYTEEYALTDVECNETELRAKLGPLSPQQCSGHFESIPCLPVAVLMHALSRSAGRLLSKQIDRELTYTVESADICADNLAFAHDTVLINVSFVEKMDEAYFYDCKAHNGDGINFGRMTLTLIPNLTENVA